MYCLVGALQQFTLSWVPCGSSLFGGCSAALHFSVGGLWQFTIFC